VAPKAITPTKVDPLPCDNPQPKYTYDQYLYPTSHLNTYYPPPLQFHERNNATYFQETPHSSPYCNHINPYERPSCEELSPTDDEIKVLKEKVEMFIQLAKEDTSKLRTEIKSEMKEGLSLDDIETKMLA